MKCDLFNNSNNIYMRVGVGISIYVYVYVQRISCGYEHISMGACKGNRCMYVSMFVCMHVYRYIKRVAKQVRDIGRF